MSHEEIRAKIDTLRNERKECNNSSRLLEIEAEIQELRHGLGKTDKKIYKLQDKEKSLKESNPNLAALIKMQRYILKSTKHISHLIQATREQDTALEFEHFHRLKSRYEHLMQLIEEYDTSFRA